MHKIYKIFHKKQREIFYKPQETCYTEIMKSQVFYKRKITNVINVQKIVTVHYQEPENGYVSKDEAHDFWEINYADVGEFTLITDTQTRVVKNGEMAFIKPNVTHRIQCEKDASIFITSFDCRSERLAFFEDKIIPIPKTYLYLLQSMMAEAKETFVIPDFDPDLKKLELLPSAPFGGEQALKNQLELLFIYLLRQEHNEQVPQQYFVSKITNSHELQDEIICFLKSKIYDTFSLDELCEKLHYGKTHLCSFFKKRTGASIYRTYIKLKINEAKKCIRKGESFSTIANKLCFDSVSHFSLAFKQITGVSPREYKASIRL